MIYLANPSTPAIRTAMTRGHLGCITTPRQGNTLPPDAAYAADNGRYGRGWPGPDAWWAWLEDTVTRYTPHRCLFAVAPDTIGDAHTTLTDAAPWLPRIRALGVPAAFVAQDGAHHPGLIPWPDLDVLFIGGSTAFKLGPHAAHIAHQATARGIPLHMGRVNSLRRLRHAQGLGAATADGTFLAYGPDKNLPALLSWMATINAQPMIEGLTL